MENTENRDYEKAIERVKARYDYILDGYKTEEFTEIVGSIGGDIERVRIYPDGRVYEK